MHKNSEDDIVKTCWLITNLQNLIGPQLLNRKQNKFSSYMYQWQEITIYICLRWQSQIPIASVICHWAVNSENHFQSWLLPWMQKHKDSFLSSTCINLSLSLHLIQFELRADNSWVKIFLSCIMRIRMKTKTIQ